MGVDEAVEEKNRIAIVGSPNHAILGDLLASTHRRRIMLRRGGCEYSHDVPG